MIYNKYDKAKMHLNNINIHNNTGLDINVCPVPVKTDAGQVDLVLLRLSDGTSEKNQDKSSKNRLFPPV